MKRGKIHPPYNEFKTWLKDNQITYKNLAELLGLTAASILKKINGQSDFTLSEVQLIKSKYGLDDTIFFTHDVA